ncbi:MAG: hypothetical protein QXU74_03935 [Candidatus Aenigmatarchaeota archaeon]
MTRRKETRYWLTEEGEKILEEIIKGDGKAGLKYKPKKYKPA